MTESPELDALLRACEESSAADPVPLLVTADWLQERGHDPAFEYALRWMAVEGKRPDRNIQNRYRWYDESICWPSLVGPRHLPKQLYDTSWKAFPAPWTAWKSGTWVAAVSWLAAGLATLHQKVVAP